MNRAEMIARIRSCEETVEDVSMMVAVVLRAEGERSIAHLSDAALEMLYEAVIEVAELTESDFTFGGE